MLQVSFKTAMSHSFEETGPRCSPNKRSRQRAMQKMNFCWGHHDSCAPHNISLKKKGGGPFFIFLYFCPSQTLMLLPWHLMQKFKWLNLPHNFCTSICSTMSASPNPVAPSRPLPSALICDSSGDFYVLFCSAMGSSGIFWP